ncbi:GTPase [Methanomassiliicoccales archaeon RumEn M1]|jgi:GTPase SAR1 family protein|nr:GTPase [Methanomassiliicoccales archaeon RumEn M1]
MRYLYFIGTAGSGKSTLVQAFKEWLDIQGIDSVLVNLDPGADFIPYQADVDIRDWINLADVMRDHLLGPNGAQVVAADLMALNHREWTDVVKEFRADYCLIDTPGQMELFTFRPSTNAIIEELGVEDSFLIFLSDPSLARTPNGFVSDLMLSGITQFRFGLPIMNVISKADILKEEDLEEMREWSRDPYALYNAITEKEMTGQSVMSIELFKAMETVGMYKEMYPVSAEEGTGMEDIYSIVQMYFEGGEDIGRNA